jgi:hypothetical protein
MIWLSSISAVFIGLLLLPIAIAITTGINQVLKNKRF